MKLFILDPFVDLLIMVCIIVNTFFMALEHPDLQSDYKSMIYISDKVNEVYVRTNMDL